MDNTTNLLRVMLLLALGIGFVLANNLLQLTPSRWQQSLYLLTANLKNEDEKLGKKTEEKEKGIISLFLPVLQHLPGQQAEPGHQQGAEYMQGDFCHTVVDAPGLESLHNLE